VGKKGGKDRSRWETVGGLIVKGGMSDIRREKSWKGRDFTTKDGGKSQRKWSKIGGQRERTDQKWERNGLNAGKIFFAT